MNEMCPNCGRHLVNYRTDRQAAGQREVNLHWTICVHCRHVALDSWSFADGIMPDGYVRNGSYRQHDSPALHEERQKQR
jgi:Zn-finger nucleic acid-binding protein